MPRYKVHYFDQDIIVEASDEAEAMIISLSEVECDSIEEVGGNCGE
jgi:hypothetical protein